MPCSAISISLRPKSASLMFLTQKSLPPLLFFCSGTQEILYYMYVYLRVLWIRLNLIIHKAIRTITGLRIIEALSAVQNMIQFSQVWSSIQLMLWCLVVKPLPHEHNKSRLSALDLQRFFLPQNDDFCIRYFRQRFQI